jgi:hypothetical protein
MSLTPLQDLVYDPVTHKVLIADYSAIRSYDTATNQVGKSFTQYNTVKLVLKLRAGVRCGCPAAASKAIPLKSTSDALLLLPI